MDADTDRFFAEWDARRPGARRSLDRARLLAGLLGITRPGRPLLTVVGSKGKGTAAAYAAAYLAAAGKRVATVTSPSHRTNRERVRVDGRALSADDMARLVDRVSRSVELLPPAPPDGYLSPSGLFVLAGVLHAGEAGCDTVVVEAGRGGRSDEASLFPPTVAAITPIFEEHLGELGDTVAEIALDKASVIGPATRAVLSAPQRDEVLRVVRAVTAEVTGGDVEIAAAGGVPADLLPAGLGAANARLGCLAARRLLDLTGASRPGPAELSATLGSISLPGRLSWHRAGGAELLLDQAVTGAAAATALAAARARRGEVDHALVCLPDDKDLPGVTAALAGTPVSFVVLDRGHLSFAREVPVHWTRLEERDLSPGSVSRLGRTVLALGTVSFMSLMLELLDVPTERLYTPPGGVPRPRP